MPSNARPPHITGLPPLRQPGAAAATAGCLAATVLAMGGRWLLQPVLGGNLTFVFAFPAVVVVAIWAGMVPALATVVLCAAASLFVPAWMSGAPAVLQASVFLMTGCAVAVLTGQLADAHRAPPVEADDDGVQTRADLSTLRWLRAGVVLSILLPWAGFAFVAWLSHHEAMDAMQRRVERIVAIAHEHALKLFDTSDLLLRQVNQDTRDLQPEDFSRERERITARLAEQVRNLAQVQSVWIVGAQGEPLASSRTASFPPGLSFADRPYVSAHRDRRDLVLVMPPRTGRVTNEVFFDLSRRREGSDGSFAGVTSMGLHPSYFTDFYRELADREKGLVVALVHLDGHVMARWPALDGPIPRLASDTPMLVGERGLTRTSSPVDGVVRIGAYRRVGTYPVALFAGTDETSAMANWRRDMFILAAFILPLSVGLALICEQALRRTRRHMDAARALRQEGRERQRVEAALRQSQKLEALGHLTGGVAHDFNNLLMVVNLNVSLLRQRLQEPGHERLLEAIERSVGAGKKLTRQLLAFSRRQPLLPRVLDLAELMPALMDLIRPALGSRIELDGWVEPGTPRVRLDSGELELALINLAVNARDAMPEGGTVRVRVRADRDGVELAFSDSGTGIAPQDIERVFEPFFTTKPVGAGTGLGLAQVYGLCARAGGSASIESRLGMGTTVLLRFPAVDAPADPDTTQPLQARAPLERLGLRVLLVEDNGDIASATGELLQAAACDVVHVAAPAEALHTLQEDPEFDVVLSDIVMPGGMDGLELCARLRRSHPRLPVVLMTGYAEKLGEAEAQGLVVLPKPFDPALLLATLREQMRVVDGEDFLKA